MKSHSTTVTWFAPSENRVWKLPDDTPLSKEQRLIEEHFAREYPDEFIDWRNIQIDRFYLA